MPLPEHIDKQLAPLMPRLQERARKDLEMWVKCMLEGGVPVGAQVRPVGELLAGQKPTPPPSAVMDVHQDKFVFCACGKTVPADSMALMRSSAGAVYRDDICRGCENAHKGTAKLMCPRCRRVRLRIPGGRRDQIGFVFEPGRTYHLDGCHACNPEVVESPIMEKVLHERGVAGSRF